MVLVLALVLSGCGNTEVITQEEYNRRQQYELRLNLAPTVAGLKIVEFDGCEYLQMRSHNRDIMTHKGNCKYCEARKNGKQN